MSSPVPEDCLAAVLDRDAGCRHLVTAAERRSPRSSRSWRRPRAINTAGSPGAGEVSHSFALLHESLMKRGGSETALLDAHNPAAREQGEDGSCLQMNSKRSSAELRRGGG